MSKIRTNTRYRYIKHRNQPICTVIDYDRYGDRVTVKWEDPDLLPNVDYYSSKYFEDGTFVPLDVEYNMVGGKSDCWHVWKKYVGFSEAYYYCDICGGTKRFDA